MQSGSPSEVIEMESVTATEITDSFCTWCWGAEPLLRRLEETYRDQLEFGFVMGGLVEDFDTFRDRANGITEPPDVAPHWDEASEHHGMPVDSAVWRENSPQSSYPANIAYEAAELQNEDLAHAYLRRLREAVTVERRNIAQESVLFELAGDVGFDVDAFRERFQSEEAQRRFEADRRFVRQSRATAFPSFRIEASGEQTWISGFQPFDAFQDALDQVAPELQERGPRPIPEFIGQHRRVATQEVAEVYEMSPGQTIQALRSLEDDGTVTAIPVGNDYLWEEANRTGGESTVRDQSRREPSRMVGQCDLDGDCSVDR